MRYRETAIIAIRKEISMSAPFKLAPLPWDEDALAPTISAKTISFHYHKHHQTYVDTLNKLVEGTDLRRHEAGRDRAQDRRRQRTPRKSRSSTMPAQVWNHDFYWRSLTPVQDRSQRPSWTAPSPRDFGSKDELIAQLAEAGKTQFGSGWAWLVSKGGKLSIEKTPNAETPMAKGVNCLLTVDVWEHAYYLDYQNARPKYLEAVLGKILNWDFAAENLTKEDQAVRAAAE